MRPEAIVFDIGNVLIEWQPERYYDQLIGADRRRALFSDVDLEGMNDRVDLGHHFTDTVYAVADAHPEWHDEIRIWHDKWIEMAAPGIPHSVRLLRALRSGGMPVFALTNFGVQTFDIASAQYPFLNEFDRHYISGHMQVMKPDPEIYRRLEVDSGVAPGRLLFTDDRPDNIEMAKKRGWQTHLFEGPEGWADCLVDAGVLSRDEAA